MSQQSGNSPIDRVVSWFKGRFGSTGSPAPLTEDQATSPVANPSSERVDQINAQQTESARDLVRPLEDDTTPTATATAEAAQTPTPNPVPSSTQKRVETINTQLQDTARKLVRPLNTAESDDLPADTGSAPDPANGTGQPTGASGDEFGDGGYTSEPVEIGDVERAADGDGTAADDTAAIPDAGPAAQEEARLDTVPEGTYAATAGDIATAGPSTEDDLGLADDGDLNATELGVLENAEESHLAHEEAKERIRFGTRTGADLSRTGLHADIRGDDGPGNEAMTAGDDYSAERAAEVLPGASRVSTSTADIGHEMASGQEVGDLVGGEPSATPPPGVAVDAEPTDEVATGNHIPQEPQA